MHKINKILCLLMLSALTAEGQANFIPKQSFTLHGYIKSLQNWQFTDDGSIYSNHLLHNRLNLRWNIHPTLVFAGEFRTRLISGDEMNMHTDFKSMLKNPNDRWDLSIAWANQSNMLILTNTERLWVSYSNKKWFFRAGRQRINWSTATTWNPNDIFNTYNFLDFDYEERPGCDAIQTRYIINANSNIEMAWGYRGTNGDIIGGIKYLIQIRGWDIQAIAGTYNKQLTLGASWAGHISETGFKGEFQMLQDDKRPIYNATAEIDYMFKKGWYGKISFLYNSEGKKEALQNRNEFIFKMTPMQQMPAAWNMEITTQKEWTPIIKSGMTIIYSPVSKIILLIPTGTISLSDDWEANIILQHFFLKENRWNGIFHNSFIRFRYSF